MSRGDEGRKKAATTERHSETCPEQSQPAIQYFLRR